MKPAPAVHTALQHVDAHDTGVHGIRVLPHGSLDDCVPRVAGGKRNQQHEQAVGPKSGQPCSSSFVPTNTPEELGSGPRSWIPDPLGNQGVGGGHRPDSGLAIPAWLRAPSFPSPAEPKEAEPFGLGLLGKRQCPYSLSVTTSRAALWAARPGGQGSFLPPPGRSNCGGPFADCPPHPCSPPQAKAAHLPNMDHPQLLPSYEVLKQLLCSNF